jgi:phosphocarrier protein
VSALEESFIVQGELGLHARPAGRFVNLAGRFESEISVSREDNEEWVSGRSVLSILSLAASQGTILKLRAEGPDAEEAVRALGTLLTEPRAPA